MTCPVSRPGVGAPGAFAEPVPLGSAAGWRALLDALDEAAVVHDYAGTVLLANRAARALLRLATDPAGDSAGDSAGDLAAELAGSAADLARGGPAVVIGDVLPALAGASGADVVEAEHGGHRCAWRPHVLGPGLLAWHAPVAPPGVPAGPSAPATAESPAESTAAADIPAVVDIPTDPGALTESDLPTDPGASGASGLGAGAGLPADLALLVEEPLVPERVAEAIVRLAVPALAGCCLVVLPAVRGRFDWWRYAADGVQERGRIGQEAVRAVPGLFELVADADPAAGFVSVAGVDGGWLPPRDFGPARDVLLVPLAGPARAPGALILLNPDCPDQAPPDHGLVTEFVRRAGAALGVAIRLREQTDVSAGLQSSLLPRPLPEVPGVRFAAAYRPARSGLRVGGDFYDVHPQDDGSTVFALGDACGHGPEAASLAGHVRSCLGALRLVERAPDRLLALLNLAIRTTSGSRFTTAVVGALTVGHDRRVRLVLASAGHPPPLVLRAAGQVEEIVVAGGLLGVFPDVRFDRMELTLAPDEVCLLYSDGVTEARRGDAGGEQYGSERLRAVVGGCVGAPADELVDAVHAELDRWLAGRNHDDITLLAIQAAPDRD